MNDVAAARLSRELTAALEKEPRVNLHQNPIHVSLDDGVVRLEGSVDGIIAKRVAMVTAHRIAGGVPVTDRLRVRSERRQEDGELSRQTVNTLELEPVFRDYGIREERRSRMETVRVRRGEVAGAMDVCVRDGIVTLAGAVESLSHRRLAEVLAWWTAGCEDVDNRLRVEPPERENDGELADAIRIVLEKDPWVRADQISIRVKDAAVTLAGYLPNAEEHRMAVQDAWYVPGVHEVIDEIQTWS